ncbi:MULTISPECIES: hypothetical protein [unclassified Crossiella]|uniref:hypothetical protein n=1 Tax=unclassified Crossiella TaxID=2620835 RepID=UPI001FFF5904|nr:MULTISPECIES: hypothetical protein [unclassified Crossiella]MCK2245405.1 hypothetical protein [Crossiella sp. S99.2]MCK2259057.1 hypothetical protein [Crossiella sp. S99.1]
MSLTYPEHRRREQLRDQFRAVLAMAMEQRSARRTYVETSNGTQTLEWVLFEREVMLAAINRARAETGRAPVRIEEVVRAEEQAIGHVDYAMKFSLYCADLVSCA